jgi:hypothetical protein
LQAHFTDIDGQNEAQSEDYDKNFDTKNENIPHNNNNKIPKLSCKKI